MLLEEGRIYNIKLDKAAVATMLNTALAGASAARNFIAREATL